MVFASSGCSDDRAKPPAAHEGVRDTIAVSQPPSASSAQVNVPVEVPGGEMNPLTLIICIDGNPCTSDWYNYFSQQCMYTSLTGPACARRCYTGSTCSAGVCSGGAPVVCTPGDTCHTGSCNIFTGQCTYPAKADGASCDDLAFCTVSDTCVNGACTGGVARDCSSAGTECRYGQCDEANDTCYAGAPRASGTPCEDGLYCTANDTCSNGNCVAGPARDCSTAGTKCRYGVCNEAYNRCEAGTPKPTGTSCTNHIVCDGNELCDGSGTCLAGTPLVVDDGNDCTDDACDAEDGVYHTPRTGSCNDGNACTQVDSCVAGACTGGNPVVCPPPPACHDNGQCNTGSGLCAYAPQTGTSCDDGNVCTEYDTCSAGTCVAGAPVNLDDGNDCTNDWCDASGVHNVPMIGAECDDGDHCTLQPDTCNAAGACTGGTPKVCPLPDACHTAGQCDRGTGECSNPPKDISDGNGCTLDWCDPVTGPHHTAVAPGALCSDGNACNGVETCDELGACVEGTPITIDDGDPCTDDSCDPVTGVKHTPVDPDADSDAGDGVAPTTLDFCDPATGQGWHPSVPPLDMTVATLAYDATRFLYTGSEPRIQEGVADDAIEAVTAALVHGRVVGRDGTPIPTVQIAIEGFGHTVTQENGNFDMAVKGGGVRTVSYTKAGYLPVHRQVTPGWNDYKVVDDVVMIQRDPVVTEVDLASAGLKVARSTTQTDDDGAREAVLMFSEGAEAVMAVPNQQDQPLTTLHVRATEYTVGDDGPKTMPAPLPPNSGYTYAVELSALNEDLEDGASIRFSNSDPDKPHSVFLYVDNFVGFDVGTTVPTGYYDRSARAWKASESGVVMRILEGGSHVDIDGDEQPDDAGGLTIAPYWFTAEELARLPQVYAPGTTVWRVPIDHFSSWDCNWGFGPPAGATPPAPDDPKPGDPDPDPCKNDQQNGSIIGCRRQTLGEALPIAGTPFGLDYTSDRAAGRVGAYSLDVPLRGDSLPPGVTGMELHVGVAGRDLDYRYSGATLATTHQYVTWDGADAWGRKLQGPQPVSVNIGYTFPCSYESTAAFGYNGNGTRITGDRSEYSVTLWKDWAGSIGAWSAKANGFGGWSLSAQLAYDAAARRAYFGDGTERRPEVGGGVISTSVGKRDQYGAWCGFTGGAEVDGQAADSVQINSAIDLAIGPSGELYLLTAGPSLGNAYVARVDTTGTLRTIYQSSGGTQPTHIAVGLDGAVYVSHNNSTKILRVDPTTGLADSFAGTGAYCDDPPPACGDNGPATLARFEADDLATGPDGSLFVADARAYRIRRVGPDGIISTFAGTGTSSGSSADGVPATTAYVRPSGIAVDGDGNLYVAEEGVNLVRRVSPDGLVTTIAQVVRPSQLAIDPNSGAIALSREQPPGYQLDLIGTDGHVDSLVSASDPSCGTSGVCGDGGLASKAAIGTLNSIVFNALGELLLADYCRVRKIAPVLPGLSPSNFAIASEAGSEQYVFDYQGRHLRTVNALTGQTIYQFDYTDKLLSQITDADGNVTNILRAPNQVTIQAPHGQTTTITLTDGLATSIAVPDDGTAHITYKGATGLIETFQNTRGSTTRYEYDDQGLLTDSYDPSQRHKSIGRAETPTGYEVTYSSAMSRETTYNVASSSGTRTLTNTYPGGTTGTNTVAPDSVISSLPDGRTVTTTLTPDPRFGMLSPVVSTTTMLPSALTSTITRSRAVTRNTDGTLATLAEASTLDGHTLTRVFNTADLKWLTTTAANRQTTTFVDLAGRPTKIQRPGLSDVTLTWNAGRISTITNGLRPAQVFSYDDVATDGDAADGYLKSVEDPVGDVTLFEHDARGRVTKQSQRGKGFEDYFMQASYDPSSELAFLSPPGHASTTADSHNFGYEERGLLQTYTPPKIGTATIGQVTYHYNDDGQLEYVYLPGDGNKFIHYHYDGVKGHPTSVDIPDSDPISYTYDPVTQQLTDTAGPCNVSTSVDHDGHLVTALGWTGDVVGDVAFTYNTSFRLHTEQVSSSNEARWTYDNDGFPTWVGSCDPTGSGTAMSLTWHDKPADSPQTLVGTFGLVSSGTFGHQVSDTWTKNEFGEVESYRALYGDSGASGVEVYKEVFLRDNSGRLLSRTDTVQGAASPAQTYDYEQGRLSKVTQDGVTHEYRYDDNGNRLNIGSDVDNAVYDSQDRLTSYGTGSTCGPNKTCYGYTDAGYLHTKTNGQGTTTYTYDALGNLRSAALPGKTITYQVDGRGRRVSRSEGTATQKFLYRSNLQVVAELDASNAIVARYVYVTGRNVPDYMIRGTSAYRIITDHLGSVRLVVDVTTTDAQQRIAERLDYDVWGKITYEDAPRGWKVPFGFAGGLHDRDTGLVRFGARDYDPEVGRWTAKDPIRFHGGDMNLYGYVVGDPVNGVDAAGLYGTSDCSYYDEKCLQSGGEYYCVQAPYWCNWFPKPPDPDPGRDDDWEGWSRCTRQCLQDCDQDETGGQTTCPSEPDDRKGPWDPRTESFACHLKCYTMCGYGQPGKDLDGAFPYQTGPW